MVFLQAFGYFHSLGIIGCVVHHLAIDIYIYPVREICISDNCYHVYKVRQNKGRVNIYFVL